MLARSSASLFFALVVIARAATDGDFRKIPIPSTATLVYPAGPVKQYSTFELGIGFPDTTPDMYGVLQFVAIKLTFPNGTTTPLLLGVGTEIWSGVQKDLVPNCRAIPGGSVSSGVLWAPLNDTGTHTVHWITTWAWPSYTHPTIPELCNGTITSQQITEEQRTFQVEAAEPPPANRTELAPRMSTLVTLSQRATGTALASKSGGERSIKVEWLGLMMMAAATLGGGLALL